MGMALEPSAHFLINRGLFQENQSLSTTGPVDKLEGRYFPGGAVVASGGGIDHARMTPRL